MGHEFKIRSIRVYMSLGLQLECHFHSNLCSKSLLPTGNWISIER